MPAESGALHADRHLRNIFQRVCRFQFFQCRFIFHIASDHGKEKFTQPDCFIYGAVLQKLRHHGRGCLANGASRTRISKIFNNTAIHFHFHIDIVAAAGIMPMLMNSGRFHFSFICLVSVIFQNQICIKLLQIHQSSYPITLRTPFNFSRK